VGLLAHIARWFGRRDDLGSRGERAAAAMLRAKGYRILGANLKAGSGSGGGYGWGEVDLLAEDPDGRTIVIVEVKTRRRAKNASGKSARIAPEASVTRAKQRKLVRLMDALCRANGWEERPKRIDVVAVEVFGEAGGGTRETVTHYEHAVGRGTRR
jgi:putative endonuclease